MPPVSVSGQPQQLGRGMEDVKAFSGLEVSRSWMVRGRWESTEGSAMRQKKRRRPRALPVATEPRQQSASDGKWRNR